MPDGTVPSSTEAVRAALSAARASLERQLAVERTDATVDAMRQVQTALDLMPYQNRLGSIADIEWIDAVDLIAPTQQARDTGYGAPRPAIANPPLAAALDQTDHADGHDLTRIRGIDAPLAARLAALGIRRYGQIAAWEVDDVRIIADAMGLGRRFLAMGVVDQARDLLRRQSEQRPPAPCVPSSANNAVAVWQPHPNAIAAQTVLPPPSSEPWRPLDGAELARAVLAVRTRLPVNHIVCLAHLVPALAQPIYVAVDHDAAIEMPRWRTGVLVPFVEAPVTPDLTRLGPHARPITAPAAQPKPPRTIVISAPTLDSFNSPSPPPRSVAEPPLHVTASHRLADLEAELAHFGPARDVQGRDETPSEPSTPIARVALPPTWMSPPITSMADDVEEADVKIVTGTRPKAGRPTLLAPLPDLPLVKRHTAHHLPGPADPRKSYQVQEAAVIIVRRNGAPLPVRQPVSHTSSVRRFLKALAGR